MFLPFLALACCPTNSFLVQVFRIFHRLPVARRLSRLPKNLFFQRFCFAVSVPLKHYVQNQDRCLIEKYCKQQLFMMSSFVSQIDIAESCLFCTAGFAWVEVYGAWLGHSHVLYTSKRTSLGVGCLCNQRYLGLQKAPSFQWEWKQRLLGGQPPPEKPRVYTKLEHFKDGPPYNGIIIPKKQLWE